MMPQVEWSARQMTQAIEADGARVDSEAVMATEGNMLFTKTFERRKMSDPRTTAMT